MLTLIHITNSSDKIDNAEYVVWSHVSKIALLKGVINEVYTELTGCSIDTPFAENGILFHTLLYFLSTVDNKEQSKKKECNT